MRLLLAYCPAGAFAAPLAAQDSMPDAPYAYKQLDDPAAGGQRPRR